MIMPKRLPTHTAPACPPKISMKPSGRKYPRSCLRPALRSPIRRPIGALIWRVLPASRCAAAADRAEASGKKLLRVSVRHPLQEGLYLEGEAIMRAEGAGARVLARIAGIGSLRGIHNAQNAACAAGAALALGMSAQEIE